MDLEHYIVSQNTDLRGKFMYKELKKFISYFFVGGAAAIIEWISFYVVNIFFNYTVATIVAFLLATTFNYFLGKIMTFKDYKQSKKDFIGVFVVSGIGLLLNLFFMFIFVDIIKIQYEIIDKILSTGFVFMWNYISRRVFIYKKEITE